MFRTMQAGSMPAGRQAAFLAAVENYASFSQVTIGGHGVAPMAQALGKDCLDGHGPSGRPTALRQFIGATRARSGRRRW